MLNSKDEVLMIVEKISPLPMFQGSWKLPGGLADPSEDFADIVLREVQEETAVTGALEGIVSMRYTHDLRFGQGDLYVLVRVRAQKEDISICSNELLAAEWMSRERIQSLVVADPKDPLNGQVSQNNWKMIVNALDGNIIEGSTLPNSRGTRPTMLYTAQKA